MRTIFSYNGPVMTFLSRLWDCVWLSILFLLCSIPVFTVGLSYGALYYAVNKSMRHERDYVTASFFHGIRANWRQTLPGSVLAVLLTLVFVMDIWILRSFQAAGSLIGSAYVLFVVFIILLLGYCIWTFAYMVRFEDPFRRVLKLSLFLMVRHLGATALSLLVVALGAFACYIIPIGLVFLPALTVWLLTAILERVFRQYMTAEDKEAEDERNMEWPDKK